MSELKMRMQLFIIYVIMIAASASFSYAKDINSHHLKASFKSQKASPVAHHGQLSVDGTSIRDVKKEVISLAGVSLFWSNTGWGQERFYNSEAIASFAKDWKAGIIRIAMGAQGTGSYLEKRKANLDRVTSVIDAAIANEIYVIVDWHSHQAEQNLDAAIEFFTFIAERYGNTPNLIYEIYNEPLNDISWELIVKPYSETIINAIRKIDPNNLIIVGTPSWSQDVDLAADNPILDQHNLLYALHFYAASHKNELREKAEYAISKGLPLIISEWGTVSSDGDGFMDEESTLEWIRFIRKNNLTHLNWAVSDKNEAASILTKGADSSGPWRPQDLTSSGKFVQKIIREW